MTVRHGFAFKGEYFRDAGDLIILTPGNFHEQGGFKPKSGKEKYYEGPVPDGYLLGRGDIVVAMTEQSKGLLGSTATVLADSTYLALLLYLWVVLERVDAVAPRLLLVVRRGFDLVEGGSSAADFCDDLFGGLVPDEGLGVVVPVFGPDLDGIDEVGHAGEHASA